MALFTYTFVNKVDRKGRVSVPASFRNELARQSFNGVAVYPSIDGSKSLTGCEEDVPQAMERHVPCGRSL